jgi:hypothetical protein
MSGAGLNIELELRYRPTPVRETRAWLVPGAGPAQWLAELTAWGVPLGQLRILPLNDGGALVLPDKTKSEQAPRLTAALPFGCEGARLYLPVEGVIDPPLSEMELRGLLQDDFIFVWQPAQGLARFVLEEAIPVCDLLALPPLGPRVWDAAEPGIAVNTRLVSISPDSPMSLDDVMEAGRGDIGKSPLGGAELPPAPGEPQGGAMGRTIKGAGLRALAAGAGMLASMAKGLGGIGQALGGGTAGKGAGNANQQQPSGKTWLQRLADWATEQQQAMNKNIDQLRNNQIERLLNLLKNSPDDGLAYALPLTGGNDHRGMSPPGTYLPPRDVNFNLSRLGGGGPADFWNLPYDYQQALRQKYRELANREISLGRHRRAAYILAELLGDISAAAAALRDGNHFREAAVLFEKKLNQPLAAAQCLQRGGLFTEAIAIYERLEAWETIAEIHDQLQQAEESAAAWRKAVEKRLRGDDSLGAAKLLEEKLKLPEEAYKVLWQSFPDKLQAMLCLAASFDLLSRLGEHERAAKQVRALRSRVRGHGPLGELALALSKLANKYPAGNVREAAADVTRHLAAEVLPMSDGAASSVMLRAIAELVPADKLLSRDCHRFGSQRAEQQRQAIVSQQPWDKSPRLVQTIHLPEAEWKAAVSIGSEYYAAGVTAHNRLLLIRGRWDGGIQHPVGEPWQITQTQASGRIILAADPRGVAKLLLHMVPGTSKEELNFPKGVGFPDPLVAGAHSYAFANTFGLGYSVGGGTIVANFDHIMDTPLDGLILQYDSAGMLNGNQTFSIPSDELDSVVSEDFYADSTWERTYFERSGWHYIGLDRLVTIVGPKRGIIKLHSPVRAITGSPPHTKPRIIFACEEGGCVLWGEDAESSQWTFARDMPSPVVGLNRGGYLIAASAEKLQVYRTSQTPLPYVGETRCRGVEPVAVLAHEQLNRFGVLSADGRVAVYEVRP